DRGSGNDSEGDARETAQDSALGKALDRSTNQGRGPAEERDGGRGQAEAEAAAAESSEDEEHEHEEQASDEVDAA
ncbi:MAG: hypothetical protein QF603_17010, partial [Alphaproteobacteria bacterium]|nr:hypothetical protein [Alphaproteobacteria bacterium]